MLAATNKVTDLLRSISDSLTGLYHAVEATAIARLLLEERFDISRVKLAMNPDMRLSESEIVLIYKDLQQLLKGIPVQYVIGYTTFRELRLNVTPDVLIPRPETEELTILVQHVLKSVQAPAILDAGTGSGAIAIALCKHIPGATVTAVDHSIRALAMARANAILHHLTIRFVCSDILQGMPEIYEPQDCIVSNPPYIPQSEWSEMDNHVKQHEPHTALFVNDADPVVFYRKLGERGMSILKSNGFLVVETHFRFADSVAAMLTNIGFTAATVHHDISGKPRFVVAERGSL